MKDRLLYSSFSSFMPKGKRGNTKVWMQFGMVLSIAVVSFVVLAILLGAMKNTSLSCNSGYTYNASADNCYQDSNNSNKGGLNEAGNVTNDGLSFITNVTGQLGTAGTILGVSLLLVIIAGIGFAGYTQYQKMR
jgi:hypothetical protein